MKKKILTFVIIMMALAIKNVYAEGTVISHGDYKFEITGFEYRVYVINENSPTHEYTGTGENSGVTVTLSEDEEKYINEEALVTSITNKTVNAEFIDKEDVMYINLNAPLQESELRNIMTSNNLELPTNEDKSYLIDYLVKFKAVQYPQALEHLYRINTVRLLFSKPDEQSLDHFKISDPTAEITQVINKVEVKFDTTTNQVVYSFSNTLSEDFSSLINMMNYTMFSNKAITNQNDDTAETYSILFHSFSNLEEIMTSSNFNTTPPSSPENGGERVAVPDTLSTQNKAFIIISIILIELGMAIMYKTIRSKKA